MSLEVSAMLEENFGLGGLRRWDQAATVEHALPEDAALLLTQTGVPSGVGVYFRAAEPGKAPATTRQGGDAWPVLGSDNGANLAVRPEDGRVWALLPSPAWGPSRLVSTDVARFLGSLALLDRALPRLAAAAGTDAVGPEFRNLRSALGDMDPEALAEPDGWWNRVLEDARHTASFPFSAAVKYQDRRAGGPRLLTAVARLGSAHPELQLAAQMRAHKTEPAAALELFTELEACLSPGHYCKMRAATLFPRVRYTYAFPYSGDAEQRDGSIVAAAQHAADQAAKDRREQA